MNDCVILVRMPRGTVLAIMDDTMDHLEVFASRDEAIEFAQHHHLTQAMPHQIVELDEL